MKSSITLSNLGLFLKDEILISDAEALEIWDSATCDWSQGAFRMMAARESGIRELQKKESWDARMKAMIDKIDSMTPLELAHEMQSHGMKFKKPLPKIRG